MRPCDDIVVTGDVARFLPAQRAKISSVAFLEMHFQPLERDCSILTERTHGDLQHLLLFYLSTREVLDNAKKEEVEKLLATVKIW